MKKKKPQKTQKAGTALERREETRPERERKDRVLQARVSQSLYKDLVDPIENSLQPTNAHAERLPFPADSFDRILMVDAFHHVCDQLQTAAELMRVLAPGGRLVVEEPDIGRFAVKLVALAEKLALMRSHFVRPAVIKEMFEARGGRVSIHRVPDDRLNVWLVAEKL